MRKNYETASANAINEENKLDVAINEYDSVLMTCTKINLEKIHKMQGRYGTPLSSPLTLGRFNTQK